MLGWLGFAMLAVIAICFALPTLGASLLLPLAAVSPKLFLGALGMMHKGVFACAALPFGCILRDKAGAEGGESASFESKVLKGVEKLTETQTKQSNDIAKVLADMDRADKEVKSAMEELTKVKNATNSSVEDINKKIMAVQKSVAINARSSFRSPIARALADEEFRFGINALARYILAAKGASKLDPAHLKFVEDGKAAHKALTGVDTGLGQATVPTATFDTIYDLLLQYGDYATLGVDRVGARTNVLPVATSRPQFYWIGSQSSLAESSQITAGAFGGGQVLLIVQTLAVLMYVARELLQDSTVDLAPYVVRQMIQSIAWGMDTAAFIGNGNADTTNAGYVGIFNAALANSNLGVSAGAGRTVVSKLLIDDFVATILGVSAQVLNKKPMWWAHPQMMARIALIKDGLGRPIFQTWQEVPSPGSIGSILGYPVHPTAIAPNTDGNSQPVAAFGDPDGQVNGIRADLELATSEDIGFPQNLVAYRTLLRAGVKILTTPGSTTLKPFAVLSNAAV